MSSFLILLLAVLNVAVVAKPVPQDIEFAQNSDDLNTDIALLSSDQAYDSDFSSLSDDDPNISDLADCLPIASKNQSSDVETTESSQDANVFQRRGEV